MGSERSDSKVDEAPFRTVFVESFCLDAAEVTNSRYARRFPDLSSCVLMPRTLEYTSVPCRLRK